MSRAEARRCVERRFAAAGNLLGALIGPALGAIYDSILDEEVPEPLRRTLAALEKGDPR